MGFNLLDVELLFLVQVVGASGSELSCVLCPAAGRPVGQEEGGTELGDRVCGRRLSAGAQDLWQVRSGRRES